MTAAFALHASDLGAAALPESLIEVKQYTAPGYAPLVDYGAWRVAMLNAIDELRPQALDQMQRHDETDEVFVLLRGRCILFIGEGTEHVTAIHAVDMEPLKAYNIRHGVWHTHTLSPDASVLVIENRDTSDANSPRTALTPQQRDDIVHLTEVLWGHGSL